MSILSACATASSSRTGATARHGPHQGAQKSTRTGLSFLRTSASKVASVVSLMAPTRGLLSVVLLGLVEGLAEVRRPPASQAAGTAGSAHADGAVVGVVLLDERLGGGRRARLVVLGEEALGVQGRGAARAGGRDGLAVGVVHEVARGEDP